MRVPGVSRSNVLLIALFAAAFAGMLLFSKNTAGGGDEVLADQQSAPFGVDALLSPHHGGKSVRSMRDVQPEEKRTSQVTPQPLGAEQIREYQEASRDALDAEEGEDRGVAIRKLESATTPQAVAALVQVLRNDPDVRNRLLAVNALSSLARSGYDTVSIRAELEAAARESDPNVASHAEEAYTELTSGEEHR
jgi:hypothetical protein